MTQDQTVGELKVTPLEYRTALELSQDDATPDDQSAEYWQVTRYYRGQIHNRSEVESALNRLRGGQAA